MTFKTISTVIMLAALISACVFFGKLAQNQPWSQALPVYGTVKDFQLTGTNNNAVGLRDLTGKVWVADFIFTTCGGICPVMSKNMAALHRSYDLVDDVRFVSVSVNPDTDTPPVLRDYARRYSADTNHWYFLTGPMDAIKTIAVESFKLGDIKEPVFHSSYFSLVDRQGRIRGYYDGTQPRDVQRLFNDIAKLIKTKR